MKLMSCVIYSTGYWGPVNLVKLLQYFHTFTHIFHHSDYSPAEWPGPADCRCPVNVLKLLQYLHTFFITLITHQLSDLVQQVVDVLAAHQSNVTLAQHASYLALQLVLTDTHHHHERHHVVQHHRQQTVLIVLKSLTLRVTKWVVPVKYLHVKWYKHIKLECLQKNYDIHHHIESHSTAQD